MATTEAIGTEFSSGATPEENAPAGIGPYALAWRRLRRNRTALAFGGLFALVVLACLLAPVYAKHVAHTTPTANHLTDQVRVHGKLTDVVSVAGIPIGPTWHGRFFLGADSNGRDVAVRLLYGGRNSLEIGGVATLITMILATLIGVAAGYFRGSSTASCRACSTCCGRIPVVILGVALGVTLAVGGLNLGLFQLEGQLADGARGDHRRHLRSVRGQARARAGAEPARARVRRRRAGARAWATSASWPPRSRPT